MLTIHVNTIEEMESLVEEGDIDLAEYRKKFVVRVGRDPRCSDTKIVIAIAATTDDDDDMFVANCLLIESGEYKIIEE